MSKVSRTAGATSNVLTLFIQDSSSTVGAGLTGLAYSTAGLTCYYKRDSGSASVAVTMADIATLGTYVSGGFKAIDGANMPGFYEFHPPDAALASGAKSAAFLLRGAANMAPCPLEIDLDAQVDVRLVSGSAATPTAGGIDANLLSVNGTPFGGANVPGDIQTIKTQGVTCGAAVTVLASVGTASASTAQTGDAFARVGAAGAGLTALGDARIANLDATVSTRLPTSGYTAPDNTSVAAIKARTDLILDAAIGATVVDTAPATGSFKGATSLSATDTFYVGSILVFTGGTLKGIARKVTGYTGSTRLLSFATAFPAAPTNGDPFDIIGLGG
jgi:hypothetical protein